MAEVLGTFRCVVLTPKAKVMDIKTCSVILPAHDGQVGILRNHMPMLVELGLGLMEVRETPHEECETSQKKHFLVDGGFAKVSANVLTVLAYDVLGADDLKPETIEKLKTKAQMQAGQGEEISSHQSRKEKLMLQLAALPQE